MGSFVLPDSPCTKKIKNYQSALTPFKCQRHVGPLSVAGW